MKFQDLLKNILLEQEDPEAVEFDNHGNPIDPDADVHLPIPDENPDFDYVRVHADNNPINPEAPPRPQEHRPERLSATQQIKMRWNKENPGVTDFEMDEAIGFFRDRRDALRPYHPYGYIDPQTNRHYVNIPELTSIVERFPSMEPILSRADTMRDQKNYPWEVMAYYIDIVRTTNELIDEENIVPGTQLPLTTQLELAKERWTTPQNQIFNQGNLIVYRIESKNESIAFGSIQRILNIKRKEEGNSRGNAYWCTTVPLNDRNRSNLWTNYRPQRAFYYLWDQTKDETDSRYCGAIQTMEPGSSLGPYTFVDLYNETATGVEWSDLVRMYPQLNGKQQLFPYFGTTPKERTDLTVDKISLTPGNTYYFGTVPKSYQKSYVDSGRHVNQVRAFLTMDPSTRKLYVDKTTKENNDLSTRFLCDDPNDPFGIIEVLRLQTKPENLYKYLDGKILKSNLGVPDGILAIKKLIIGTNWRRWLSDITTHQTLISSRGGNVLRGNKPKYGIMNIENGDLVKDIQYVAAIPRSYLFQYVDDNGIKQRKRYIFQRYDYTLGNGQTDPNEYFYFLYLVEALTDKNSEFYLKGKYYDGTEGDQFIQGKIASGEFKRM